MGISSGLLYMDNVNLMFMFDKTVMYKDVTGFMYMHYSYDIDDSHPNWAKYFNYVYLNSVIIDNIQKSIWC